MADKRVAEQPSNHTIDNIDARLRALQHQQVRQTLEKGATNAIALTVSKGPTA
ncbi:hypothetical protein JC795_26595 [Pseudomonas veronii]|uniref:hypothetical protein n=1 Tax=Pseudomonas veronii TaxID=76761 RepID=UPI0018E8986A|nr:hypothetical protein [Pseudomonas veronii]MBJ2181754.1 hypothetical protein [Pseudomonas veronii]